MSDEQQTSEFFRKLMQSHDTNWMTADSTGNRHSSDAHLQQSQAHIPLKDDKIGQTQQSLQPSDQQQLQPTDQQQLQSSQLIQKQQHRHSQQMDSLHPKPSNNSTSQPSSKVQETDPKNSIDGVRQKNTTARSVDENSKAPVPAPTRKTKVSGNLGTSRVSLATKERTIPEVVSSKRPTPEVTSSKRSVPEVISSKRSTPEVTSSRRPTSEGTSSRREANTGSGGNCRLFVGGLPFDATKDKLYPLFQRYGQIVEIVKKVNIRYGFVEYADRESAFKAVDALNGVYYLGDRISVQFSKPRHHTSTHISNEEPTNHRSNVFSRLSSQHDQSGKSSLRGESKDNSDKRQTISNRQSTPPGRRPTTSQYSDLGGKRTATTSSSKRDKDSNGDSKRNNDAYTPSNYTEDTGHRDRLGNNSQTSKSSSSDDRNTPKDPHKSSHDPYPPSEKRNNEDQQSAIPGTTRNPPAKSKDIKYSLKRSPNTKEQMENTKRLKTEAKESSHGSMVKVTGTPTSNTNLSNATKGSSDGTANNSLDSNVLGDSRNEDPRLLFKAHATQPIDTISTGSMDHHSSTIQTSTTPYHGHHQSLSSNATNMNMAPPTNNVHNMPVFMPSVIPFIGSNDGPALQQPHPPHHKLNNNNRPIIQLICTSMTLPPDVVARMEDHLTYYLPSMKCRTVFFPSTTSTREDVLKRLHMNNVQAVIMVENGYEQHGKIFLQVYDQLGSGNDGLHFDEYEFITIYDVVAILQHQLATAGEPTNGHSSPSVVSNPIPSSFIRHTPPPIKVERPHTDPSFPPSGATVPQNQHYAIDLLHQLQQQQRHAIPFPAQQPVTSPPPPTSTLLSSSNLDYYLALSSHQPFDHATLEKILKFLDETQHLPLTSTSVIALQLLGQRTLGQLKNIQPSLQPEQEMRLQNYLVSHLNRIQSQPPPTPFPSQGHQPSSFSPSFSSFYKNI